MVLDLVAEVGGMPRSLLDHRGREVAHPYVPNAPFLLLGNTSASPMACSWMIEFRAPGSFDKAPKGIPCCDLRVARNHKKGRRTTAEPPYDHCVCGLSCSSPSTSRSTFSLKKARSPFILAASGIGSA